MPVRAGRRGVRVQIIEVMQVIAPQLRHVFRLPVGSSVAATLDAIVANGGEIVQPIGSDILGTTARFRDPAGNVIGLYQQPT